MLCEGYSCFKLLQSCYEICQDRQKVGSGLIFVWSAASLRIDYPMLFEVHNSSTSRTSHCGVLEFVAEEGMIYMPYWVCFLLPTKLCILLDVCSMQSLFYKRLLSEQEKKSVLWIPAEVTVVCQQIQFDFPVNHDHRREMKMNKRGREEWGCSDKMRRGHLYWNWDECGFADDAKPFVAGRGHCTGQECHTSQGHLCETATSHQGLPWYLKSKGCVGVQ